MKKKPIIILGHKLDPINYPVLYDWASKNPATLEATVISIAKAWHNGNNISAMQALESDLEHDYAV